MMTKIGLEDVRLHAPHGYYDEEQLMGNEFSIDVEVEAAVGPAAEQDELAGTINYATIYYLLQAEMKKPTRLLEALAHRMADRIFRQFEEVESVRLRLRKLNPPLGGRVGAAFVEVRLGGDTGGAQLPPGMLGQQTFEDPEDDPYPDDFKPGGGFDVSGFNF